MMSSFDPPFSISYQWVIGTEPLSQTVFEIFASKYECARTDGRTKTQVKQYIRQFHSVHLADIITND